MRAGQSQNRIVTRRHFLRASAVSLAAPALTQVSCAIDGKPRSRHAAVRFGIVTDCHYADANTAGSRYYRHSLDKLAECAKLMNAQKVDFLIELGDLKDQDNPPLEQRTLSYLRAVENMFQEFNGPTYHVVGNHDADSISKTQFLANVENTGIDPAKSCYSFDFGSVRFVVLDANYTSDGVDYDHGNFDWTNANIPPAELAWLRQDLAAAPRYAIVFVHQRLDGGGAHYVKNAAAVRRILEQSGKVLAVFQGHQHAGGYSNVRGIHYYTLKALVEGPGPENSSYAVVEVRRDDGITIIGYRKAITKQLDCSAVRSVSFGPGDAE